MAGKHGKATKFWMIYIYYVNTYRVLHHVIKTNDFTVLGLAKVKMPDFAAENILKKKLRQVAKIANIKGYVWK